MTGAEVHVRCGHDILGRLEEAGLPGTFLCWADPLCEGPVTPDLAPDKRRALRADWLANRFGEAPADMAARLSKEDAALETALERAGEVVLWFEHDLYDQIILSHLLQRLAPFATAGGRVTLICIGDHPSVDRFCGLGQLDAGDLATLFVERQPVTGRAFEASRLGWQAFAEAGPEQILALITDPERLQPLPFLIGALRRHLQQYPWRADGLALTEWMILDAIDLGANSPLACFKSVQLREEAPWLGDAMFFAWVRDLAAGTEPLLVIDDPEDHPGCPVRLTERGRAVLFGKSDAFQGRTVDRWLGGYRLTSDSPWRWDANAETLVRID